MPAAQEDVFAAQPTTPRGAATPGFFGASSTGGPSAALTGSPARARTQSNLPSSISSKAPPALNTLFEGAAEGDTVDL
jgi:hypothetical protein